MTLPAHVTVKEVGPRDGLQNDASFVETEDKVAWIEQMIDAGAAYIECTSFVHPKWVPALKDHQELMQMFKRRPGVTYAALVPNMKGLEGALRSGVDEVSVFMSASETHNQKNINKTIAETHPVLEEVIREAKAAGCSVRAYISTAFACPYEGTMAPETVLKAVDPLLEAGINELSIGDTIGAAAPLEVDTALKQWVQHVPKEQIAMHFHDTRGTALANVYAALQQGVTTFDAAGAGLGGCPYAPGAGGNLATEDLLYFLHRQGIETGMDEAAYLEAAEFILPRTTNAAPGKVLLASRGEKEAKL
ncbi:hydroxymethylglutaryl-CoA lyase [Salsuginibacillus halophilus]|uniref:Hydroxymethylglutaryl-CoA lyase n=1 Tax=Salsuginibacillus halophilus TaxID=517424 RepID=A0A2P8HG32_9BACI|nr:hydroxymethylglutaryl-CoA lyase [Salsuginibacillus halophilus]PSL45181.1 hydroxymethylglutaryl-CoA lyase [Salsuginibacillus halophilus]